MPDKIIAYTDGASRGNPGPAAAGFVLKNARGATVRAKAFFIGRATNNIAEYTALVKAIEAAQAVGTREFIVRSDSELLVRQINGRYKIKSEQIRPLLVSATNLLDKFESWKVEHVPREMNTEADRLVNEALNLGRDVEEEPAGRGPGGKTLRLGVLISGGGTTLLNILDHIKEGRLNATVAVVISSRSTVAGVERARNAGLDVKIIRKKDYPDIDEFSKRLAEELAAANVDLVIQGGWLCLWKIPVRYHNRVMNIHPALLPSFGGKGMWGHHVHEAVLNAGCKVSGCTVHFCTDEYDNGPIIVQRTCPVEERDTAETLGARVFEQECIAYPRAISLFSEGRLLVEQGTVRIKS
ncbi:MAG: phosphoribosylglycinamide formyltransferase [Phycisphaerales bacterium]|nr:MAG: phosphoribosylglycinamide formyltransferase [Phycisphaerales bacterium]